MKLIISNVNRKLEEKALPGNVLKISVDSKSGIVSFAIFPEEAFARLISGEIHIEAASMFTSPQLKGYSYSLVVTNRNELINNNTIISAGKNINNEIKRYKTKDFMDADKYRYGNSPNTDGHRMIHEYFAGSGSNMRTKR